MEKQILDFLNKIEKGEIKITPTQDPCDVYSGNVLYLAENGWELTIFNDSNEWDYIESIKTNDNTIFDFDFLDEIISIRNYEPNQSVIENVYKIKPI